ncbi:MAG: hypothetical protein QM723_17060 [Myxococcaceae bacterium]
MNVVVTRRSLIVDRAQWYLRELKLVSFTDSWRNKETSFALQTKAGELRIWSLPLSNIDDLAKALSDLGVPVVKG